MVGLCQERHVRVYFCYLKLVLLAAKFTIRAQVFCIRYYTVNPILFPAGFAAVITFGALHAWRAIAIVPTEVGLDMVGDCCLIQSFLPQLFNEAQPSKVVVGIESLVASLLRLNYTVSLPYADRLGMQVQHLCDYTYWVKWAVPYIFVAHYS